MNELQEISDSLKRIRINDEPLPQNIMEIKELRHFGNFHSLLLKINNGYFKPYIPNQHLHNNFEIIADKKAIRLNKVFQFAPFIIGIAVVIYGILNYNYFLLLAIPIIFISQFLSGFFSKILSWISLFATAYFLIFSSNLTVGLIFLTSYTTFFFSNRFREHRRTHMLKQALSSEEIFCFLFYTRILSLWDSDAKKVVNSIA